jgi:hypothetical protein
MIENNAEWSAIMPNGAVKQCNQTKNIIISRQLRINTNLIVQCRPKFDSKTSGSEDNEYRYLGLCRIQFTWTVMDPCPQPVSNSFPQFVLISGAPSPCNWPNDLYILKPTYNSPITGDFRSCQMIRTKPTNSNWALFPLPAFQASCYPGHPARTVPNAPMGD